MRRRLGVSPGPVGLNGPLISTRRRAARRRARSGRASARQRLQQRHVRRVALEDERDADAVRPGLHRHAHLHARIDQRFGIARGLVEDAPCSPRGVPIVSMNTRSPSTADLDLVRSATARGSSSTLLRHSLTLNRYSPSSGNVWSDQQPAARAERQPFDVLVLRDVGRARRRSAAGDCCRRGCRPPAALIFAGGGEIPLEQHRRHCRARRRCCRSRSSNRRAAAASRRRRRRSSRSRMALAYSARFRRRSGARPGFGCAAAARSSSCFSQVVSPDGDRRVGTAARPAAASSRPPPYGPPSPARRRERPDSSRSTRLQRQVAALHPVVVAPDAVLRSSTARYCARSPPAPTPAPATAVAAPGTEAPPPARRGRREQNADSASTDLPYLRIDSPTAYRQWHRPRLGRVSVADLRSARTLPRPCNSRTPRRSA